MRSERIGRLGFFLGYLYLMIFAVFGSIIIIVTSQIARQLATGWLSAALGIFAVLFAIVFMLLCICIFIDLCMRRFHDIGQSGLLVLLFLVPAVGSLVFLVLLFLPGNAAQNQYGYPVSGLGFKQIMFNRYSDQTVPPVVAQ